MDKFDEIAERIVGVNAEDRPYSDNLAIVLCSYFSAHINRPNGDEDDMDEGGWSPWTIEKYNASKKMLSDYVATALRIAVAEERKACARMVRIRATQCRLGVGMDAEGQLLGAAEDIDDRGDLKNG